MTPSPTPAGQPLGVWLLPATAAYDYEHWEVRLVNPGLLLGAVAVALHRLPLLAVPVGADRRGGLMGMAGPGFARALAVALRGRPGFDGVTVSGQVVRWGAPMPEGLAPEARRRFQGLREEPGHGTPVTSPRWTQGPCSGRGEPASPAWEAASTTTRSSRSAVKACAAHAP